MNKDPIVRLAPMVGLTHYAFRQALAEFLPEGYRVLWPTEMLNSRRLPSQKEDQNPELTFKDKKNGLCPQLLGNEESFIRDSVKKLEDWGAEAIDINMGCPVQKALRHNYGVSLMGDSAYAASVTEMATRHAKVPVSVKLRAGFTKDEKFLIQFAKGLESAGASWITLHPRTADQGRRGECDWNLVSVLKQELKIPVHGNGDVQCFDDVRLMRERTGCDAVIVGRALTAKPWLVAFSQDSIEPSEEEKLRLYQKLLLRVIELSEANYSEADGLRRLRFLVFHGHVWLEFGHHFYSRVKHAPTYTAAREIIINELSRPQRFVDRTHLRG